MKATLELSYEELSLISEMACEYAIVVDERIHNTKDILSELYGDLELGFDKQLIRLKNKQENISALNKRIEQARLKAIRGEN